jgi:predicted DNA-binding ribbon-helix-helix protein
MQSTIKKHSVVIAGHKTSISLENEFWDGLREIAQRRHSNLSDLLASLQPQGNLSSAIRLMVLEFYQTRALQSFAPSPTRVPGSREPKD